MCNAFLWKGSPNSARGAKVSWETVCTPKESGGLGLRRLTSWNTVLGLKLIWLLFSSAGSLWVSWVRINLIGNRNFWDLNSTTAGSWIWRKLCKLRPIARQFVVCEVESGITAKFWHDNWTGLGPLLDITGPAGPQTVGLPLNAVVRDAIRGNQWWISSSRSRSSAILRIKNALPEVDSLIENQLDDSYLWKTDNQAPSNLFSTSKTWTALHPPSTPVLWHKSVWFSNQIPKHAFISWIAAWNRLATRDRLRSWGCQVPSTCLLCNREDESRDHIFFACEFSTEIWSYFISRLNLNPPPQYQDCLLWLHSASRDKNISLIIKLLHQAVVYFIWSERNQRLHSDTSRPPAVLIREIQQIIRAKLLPLSIAHRSSSSSSSHVSPLASWFGIFPFR